MAEETSVPQSDNVMKSSYAPMANNPNIVQGVIKIKLTRAAGDEISVIKNNGMVQSSVTPLNTLLSNIKATGMRRLFPYAGKFEERTRREGLHLWYVVSFDTNIPVNKAVYEAKQLKEIEIVEEKFKIKLPDCSLIEDDAPGTTEDEEYPVNDPLLDRQWHYHNTGKLPGSVKGADINLFSAWKEEVGKPNVIVDIVDGGVDFSHEDLKDNMYVNEAELNGTEGVDDDNNGYVDDIYGYNFVTGKGEIVPQPHGTHVAGTVAARNNNGIGVCGVAGGDGTPDSGIRLMSSQMFLGNRGGDAESAIKYGADNGAVISQNSWGYPYPGPGQISPALKAAIDYFVKYAGCDNEGNQLPDSPMKGGVIIFAAGNDDKEFLDVPAYYKPVVAVAAMAPDFTKASYSTYGTWVDITAPGGDGDRFGIKAKVYSTIPGNKYAYMNGTSMACPHVSGVAALIVSKFGGSGFTNKDLKKRLLTGLRPFNIDKYNPKYKGKLGIGYIDSYAVLAKEEDNIAPEMPKITKITPDFTSLMLEWASVKDENDTTPTFYNLYYSEEKLDKNNYKDAEKIQVNGYGYKVGVPITYTLKRLPLNTSFYFAIEAVDRWGATSDVDFTEGKTKENHAPVIIRTDDTPIRITDGERVELKLKVTDPDEGQPWFFDVTGHKRGVSYKKTDDGILLKFRVSGEYGKFSLKVAVRDIFDASAEIEIPFEYYKNEPPVLSKNFEKIYTPVGKTYTIDLNNHFTDPEGEKMIFTAQTISGSFNATVNDNILSITPSKLGNGTIEITAKDSEGETVKGTLNLQAVNDNIVYLAYPVPVNKILNVRLSNEVNNAKLTVRTLTGKAVYEKDVTVSNNNRLVTLNLGKVSGGTYVLYAEANGKTYKQTFIKY